MNNNSVQTRRLHDLIDRLLDGRISDEEVQSLNVLLENNSSAQDLLLDYCQFHAVLTFDLHAEKAIDRIVEQRKRTVVADALRKMRVSMRTAYAVALALAAGLFLAIGIPWMSKPSVRHYKPAESVVRPEVAHVKIESGTTQLTLANVGTVVLQGPAEFELLGPTRARLTRGRIKVRVTEPGGHGFVVQMPNGEVTDLGTEFGIDVSDEFKNGLLVFEGAVDLRVPQFGSNSTPDYVGRLVEGDGVVINQSGKVDRIMAIFTGRNGTFGQFADSAESAPLIADVKDNLGIGETNKFYEIVPQGLYEDARSYADRTNCEWNGVEAHGMPPYLIGADYVKPFNNDKMRKDFQLDVTLSRPARLFVFFDNRIPPPSWLVKSFKDTGDDIGVDVGPFNSTLTTSSTFILGEGPGAEIDHHYSVWERVVEEPATISLGANAGRTENTGMYGIAAADLDPRPRRPGLPVKAASLLNLKKSHEQLGVTNYSPRIQIGRQ